MELLIHSLSEFRELIDGVLDTVRPRHVVEVGAESGSSTAHLLAWAAKNDARLTTIDPAPAERVRELAASAPDRHRLILDCTPGALDEVEAAQMYLLDGDHNHYTVTGELRAIHEATTRAGEPAVVVLHDVAWPCARRDFYYDPSRIPEGSVLPHTFEKGLRLGAAEPDEGGFRSNGVYAIALREGGPRNGVLTAVEDFIAEHGEHDLFVIPAVFGLGVLVPRAHPAREVLSAMLGEWHQNPLIRRLEENRLRNWIAVIDLQDRLAAVEKERDAGARDLEAVRADVRAAEEATRATMAERDALARENAALAGQLVELERRLADLEGRWFSRVGSRIDERVKRLRGR